MSTMKLFRCFAITLMYLFVILIMYSLYSLDSFTILYIPSFCFNIVLIQWNVILPTGFQDV